MTKSETLPSLRTLALTAMVLMPLIVKKNGDWTLQQRVGLIWKNNEVFRQHAHNGRVQNSPVQGWIDGEILLFSTKMVQQVCKKSAALPQRSGPITLVIST